MKKAVIIGIEEVLGGWRVSYESGATRTYINKIPQTVRIYIKKLTSTFRVGASAEFTGFCPGSYEPRRWLGTVVERKNGWIWIKTQFGTRKMKVKTDDWGREYTCSSDWKVKYIPGM